MLKKFLDKHTVARPTIDDTPRTCPKCSCPVQWRPFEYVPWSCFDCDSPLRDAVCRFARILCEQPDGAVGWRVLRPLGLDPPILAGAAGGGKGRDVDFDALPEPMTAEDVAGYLRWMERVGAVDANSG
jgi:hypothetical protein